MSIYPNKTSFTILFFFGTKLLNFLPFFFLLKSPLCHLPPFPSQSIHWGEVDICSISYCWILVDCNYYFCFNMPFTFVETVLCLLKTCNWDVIVAVVGCDVSSVASFIIAKKVCCERDRHLREDGRFMPQTNFWLILPPLASWFKIYL